MTEQVLEILTLVAEVVAGVCAAAALGLFFRKRPCWLFNCDPHHVAISDDRLWVPNGECHRFGDHYVNNYRHSRHREGGIGTPLLKCTVTRWVCRKCGKMGYFCVGDSRDGAWTIDRGQIVPDLKKWASWPGKEAS